MSFGVAAAILTSISAINSILNPPKAPSIPSPAAPIPPPQASQAPDVQGIRAQAGANQGGGAAGVASTMLSGAGGVDPNNLDLKKTTLLGG